MEQDIKQAAAGAIARFPQHEFTFPDRDPNDPIESPGVREFSTDPHTVVIRQLTFEEERQALEAMALRKTTFSYEGALRSVVSADGKEITWKDNGKETFFAGLSNQVRDLLCRAFASIALPTPRDADRFFQSKKTKSV